MRAIRRRIEHRQFLEARDRQAEHTIPAHKPVPQQYRPRDQRTVRSGQFRFVDPVQHQRRTGRTWRGLRRAAFRLNLKTGGAGDGNGAGLAFNAGAIEAANDQFRLVRIELLVVGDHQRVAAPGLLLQPDDPRVAGQFLAADVRAGKLDVLPARRHLDAEFLHALVEQPIPDRRAAAQQTVANGHQIEHLRRDARRKTLGREHQFPISLLGIERERFVAAPPAESVDRDLACANQRVSRRF